MRRLYNSLFILALMVLGLQTAQSDDVIDVIGGQEGAMPVAVIPFAVSGGVSAPDQDIARIIGDNLARSGRFEVLSRDELVARPAGLDDTRFSSWRGLGMDYLVTGRMEMEDDNISVTFELLDVFRGNRIEGRRYQLDPRNLRSLAHAISDIIFEEVVGLPGVFSSQIAYVEVEERDDQRLHRLMISDADGHRPREVLESPQPIMSPAWSPNRDRLAYVSFEAGRSEIYVQNLRTGEREQIASFRGINSAPAWSPDGEHLAVTLSRDGRANIYLLRVSDGDTRRLTDHWAIDTEPTFSPDGEQIAFTSDRGGRPQVYKMAVNGPGGVERVTYDGDYNARPNWSPDGRRLAMVHRHNGDFRIAVHDLESERTRVLTDGPWDESPVFAPNGDMIMYSAGGSGDSQLRTVSVHGRANQTLPRSGGLTREPAW